MLVRPSWLLIWLSFASTTAALRTATAQVAPPPVRTGIDVLAASEAKELQGKALGLITNHTGRTNDGRRTVDVLQAAPGVKLVALLWT